jgi:hypothetical protein
MRVRNASRGGMRASLAITLVALAALGGPAPVAAQNSPSAPAQPTVEPAPVAPSTATADVESLRARAATFWAARVAGDSKAQWELLEPRGRGRTSPGDYVRGGPIKYLGYQIEDVTVIGYFARVKVRLVVVPFKPGGSSRTLGTQVVVGDDEWVRIKGVWYRTFEQDRSRVASEHGQ